MKDQFTSQNTAINDIKDPSISSLFQDINKNKINEEHKLLITIRRLLWNEEDITEIEDIDSLLASAILFWKHGHIDKVDLKVLINQLQIKSRLQDESFILIADLILGDQQPLEFSTWVDLIRSMFEDLGNYIPNLSEVVRVYDLIYGKNTEIYQTLISLVDSLQSRPEYFTELVEFASTDDLLKILPWVDWKNKRLITEYLLNKELESIDSEDFQETFSSKSSSPNSILHELPNSFSVLGQAITNFPAQTLDSKDFEHIPPEHISSWAPKFVYSRPEIAQKIKIFFPGGNEIGHSAIIVKTNEGMLLLDFGLSVVNNTFPSWSHLLEKVDAILLSHAHLDHSGGLPLLYHNQRKLPWFAKKETKIMTELLWNDTANIVGRNVDEDIKQKSEFKHISNHSNINNALNNFNEIDLKSPLKVLPKVTVQAYNAAHLYGSVGFEIDIDGKRLLYTGDFNLDNMQKSKSKMFPSDVDSIIFDGTYWGRPSQDLDTETTLNQVLASSKRILIPAFGMGRSQEMLFNLTQLGAEKKWKIYITGMGGKLIKKLHLTVGPSGSGRSAGVNIVPTVDPDDFGDNCIVICGQGMLQAGTSRNLFESTADDPNTSVVLCGYQAPNTLGYHLLNQHPSLISKFKQQIYRVKMSGHSSSKSLNNFISTISGTKIMVHSPVEAKKHAKKSDITVPIGPLDL